MLTALYSSFQVFGERKFCKRQKQTKKAYKFSYTCDSVFISTNLWARNRQIRSEKSRANYSSSRSFLLKYQCRKNHHAFSKVTFNTGDLLVREAYEKLCLWRICEKRESVDSKPLLQLPILYVLKFCPSDMENKIVVLFRHKSKSNSVQGGFFGLNFLDHIDPLYMKPRTFQFMVKAILRILL